MKARITSHYELKFMSDEAVMAVAKFCCKKSADVLFNSIVTRDRAKSYGWTAGYCIFTGNIIPKEAITDIGSEKYRLVEFSSPTHPQKMKLLVDYAEAISTDCKINKDLVDDMLTLESIKPEYHDMLVSDDVTWTLVGAKQEKKKDEEAENKENKGEAGTGWICPKCFTQNSLLRTACSECGHEMNKTSNEKASILTNTDIHKGHQSAIEEILSHRKSSAKHKQESVEENQNELVEENGETEKVADTVKKGKRGRKKGAHTEEKVSLPPLAEENEITEETAKELTTGNESINSLDLTEVEKEIMERSKVTSLEEFLSRKKTKQCICQGLYNISRTSDDFPVYIKERILRILNEVDGLPAGLFYGNTAEKIKLYTEQLGYCLYSGNDIDLKVCLFSDKYNVDHILPRALGGADEDYNKALVQEELNTLKGAVYPIDKDVIERMKFLWLLLNSYDLIPDKKSELLFGILNSATA